MATTYYWDPGFFSRYFSLCVKKSSKPLIFCGNALQKCLAGESGFLLAISDGEKASKKPGKKTHLCDKLGWKIFVRF